MNVPFGYLQEEQPTSNWGMFSPNPSLYQMGTSPIGSSMMNWNPAHFVPNADPAAAQMEFLNRQFGYQQGQDKIRNDLLQKQVDAMTPTGFQRGASMFGNIAQGVGSLANVYMGLKSLSQAKKEFNFNKEVANANLNNSITDYNRRLTDTLSNRALNNGQGQSWVSDQVSQFGARR